MMTDSAAQEDQQCNAAKLLEVTILQCRGHMDQVLLQYSLAHGKCNVQSSGITNLGNNSNGSQVCALQCF